MQPQEEENEEKKHPPSPPMDEGNTQDFADDKLCFYDSKNDEEHGLNMLYDNALDDGPMIIDNTPCLVFITLCDDKNDILAACDNTLTHEIPTLFLNSPIHTMEEKFAYVEKYLCGLQLSLVPNICCNHDIKQIGRASCRERVFRAV